MCHVNNIEYDPSDDSLVFSDLDNVCLTKVSKTGGSTDRGCSPARTG